MLQLKRAKPSIDEALLHRHASAVLEDFQQQPSNSPCIVAFLEALAGLTEPRASPPPLKMASVNPAPALKPAWVSNHEAPWLQVTESLPKDNPQASGVRLEDVHVVGKGIWRGLSDASEATRVTCPLCGTSESVTQMAMHLTSHRTALHSSMQAKERDALAKHVELNRIRLTGAIEMFEALANSKPALQVVGGTTNTPAQPMASLGQKRSFNQFDQLSQREAVTSPRKKARYGSAEGGKGCLVPEGGWGSRREASLESMADFPYIDENFLSRAKKSPRWKSFISGDADSESPEMEILTAIFPEMDPCMLHYALALAEGRSDVLDEDSTVDTELLVESATSSLEPWGSLQGGEGGKEGEALYKRLVSGIQRFNLLLDTAMQAAELPKAEQDDDDQEEEENGESVVEHEGDDTRTKTRTLENHEIWGAHRCDTAVSATAPGSYQELTVGRRVALLFDKAWWEAEVLELRAEQTARVKLLVPGVKQTIRLSDHVWRIYRNPLHV